MTLLEPHILTLLEELKKNQNLYKIIICHDDAQAQKIQKNIFALSQGMFHESNMIVLPGFVQTGVFKYESAKKIIAQRLNVSHTLAGVVPRVNIVSVSGFIRSFPSIAWIQKLIIHLKSNQEYDFEMILEGLLRRVYNEVKQVEEVGEFAVRGSIIDVWTPGQSTPVRLEFSDNRLEKIKLFRVHDQKSFSTLNNVNLLPCREFVWPSAEDVDAQIEQFNLNILKQKVEGINRSNLLEDFKSRVPFAGIDDVAYMFSQQFPSFFSEFRSALAQIPNAKFDVEYFSSQEDIQKELIDIENLYISTWKNSTNKNSLIGKMDALFTGLEEFKNSFLPEISEKRSSFAAGLRYNLPFELFGHAAVVSSRDAAVSSRGSTAGPSTSKETFHTRVLLLKEYLQKKLINKIIFAVKNRDASSELIGLLIKYFPEIDSTVNEFDCLGPAVEPRDDTAASRDDTAAPRDDTAAPRDDIAAPRDDNQISTIILDIDGCFFLQESKSLVISENILRGRATHKDFEDFSKSESKTPLQQTAQNSQIFFSSQFSDFSEGDLVVHVQHGICRFRGLATVKVIDIINDFLVLEFAGHDKIYVPVSKLNLVQKYVGSSASVELDSLKAKAWEKRREKAKKDVELLAQKLLEHHAKQIITPGTAFSKIGEDYIAFEDAFPFEDTPDQRKATQEIMVDMSLPKAMDRLLCGDVGFGKTEVAMRACYRAILDGKQVAWLVPTTVLAYQHFRTLCERFKPFGVNVCMLDRTSNGSTKNLEKIKKGEVDILIGTHRILASDIHFRDLGLLVVDEEQHFGVMQKEKIKSMSYGIDVLTLTATPIPRTLQMALLGIRHLSLLTTPPKSRLATKTFVCPFEDKIIVDAIRFELSRGGQIFYIHNRVEELESVKTYLSALIPNLRIQIGHGKISKNDLEKTVVEFLDGKFDLFLCTTIVEAGIDMPNVNTILVQNADTLGLAQLYQLRGRVGRRSTRGFAYFLVPTERFELNSDGMKRLEILKDHQELGSGFIIASQDLEMRGAGEILGDEQSGKVSEIGLETYLQMLDDAIKQLGGVRVERKTEVDLQIPLTIQIPENYIEGARDRLLMYRRFFGARDESALMALIQECDDRFGKIPEEVQDLADISRIRRLLLTFGAISLNVGEETTECRLDQKILQSTDEYAEAFVKRVLDLCNRQSKNMRITQDGRLIFPLKRKEFIQNKQTALHELKRVLSLLAGA